MEESVPIPYKKMACLVALHDLENVVVRGSTIDNEIVQAQ